MTKELKFSSPTFKIWPIPLPIPPPIWSAAPSLPTLAPARCEIILAAKMKGDNKGLSSFLSRIPAKTVSVVSFSLERL